jgi:ureidoacrylate peracid hydrolase
VPVIWLKQEFSADSKDAGLLPFFHSASPISNKREKPLKGLQVGSVGSRLWKDCDYDSKKDFIISKCRYSPFTSGSSNLDGFLRTLKRDTLIITGVATNICCETTARDAMMYDYKVVLVSDATATNDQILHEISLMNIKLFFGDIALTCEVINEISEA